MIKRAGHPQLFEIVEQANFPGKLMVRLLTLKGVPIEGGRLLRIDMKTGLIERFVCVKPDFGFNLTKKGTLKRYKKRKSVA